MGHSPMPISFVTTATATNCIVSLGIILYVYGGTGGTSSVTFQAEDVKGISRHCYSSSEKGYQGIKRRHHW